MFYTENILRIAQELCSTFGKLHHVEDSVFLLTGTPNTIYTMDLRSLMHDQAPVILAALQMIFCAEDSRRTLILTQSELRDLHGIAQGSSLDADRAQATLRALERFKAVAGHSALTVMDGGDADNQQQLEILHQLVACNYDRVPVILIAIDRVLGSWANGMREVWGKDVLVVYPQNGGVVRHNNSLPLLRATPMGKPLPVTVMAGQPQGPFFVDGRDTPIHLGAQLGHGGEAAVYEALDRPGYVYKLYNCSFPAKDNYSRKLREMALLGDSAARDICLPCGVLTTEDGDVCGVVLRKLEGIVLDELFQNEAQLQALFPTRMEITLLAHRILIAVYRLMLAEILPTDLKCSNIMIDAQGNPCLFDLDSAQMRRYPGLTASLETTPPERSDRNLTEELRDAEDLNFAVAAVIFQVLHLGLSPFVNIGTLNPVTFVFPEKEPPQGLEQEFIIFSNLSRDARTTLQDSLRCHMEGDKPRAGLTKLYTLLLMEESSLRGEASPERLQLYPTMRKPSGRLCACTGCGKTYPRSELLRSHKHLLCKDCSNQTLPAICPDCGQPVGTTLLRFLRLNRCHQGLPIACPTCTENRLRDGIETVRPITSADRAAVQRLLEKRSNSSRRTSSGVMLSPAPQPPLPAVPKPLFSHY